MGVLTPGEELTPFTHRIKENSSASLLPLSICTVGIGEKLSVVFRDLAPRQDHHVWPNFCLLLTSLGLFLAAHVTQHNTNKGQVFPPLKSYLQEVPNQKGVAT